MSSRPALQPTRPAIGFDGEWYECLDGETVLDCLLRNGRKVPFSCKAGVCQSCLMQATGALPPASAQKDLTPAQKQQGFFLACQWRPESGVEIRPADERESVGAEIRRLIDLNRNTKRVVLEPTEPFDCLPGQYLSLMNPANVARSYSVANRPEQDGHIELHVRRISEGQMSGWLHEEARPGDFLRLRGPFGSCCYPRETEKRFPILLAGIGTGLAPLRAVVLDALAHGHEGPIVLVHGARTLSDLYLVDELRSLEVVNDSFVYQPCALKGESAAGIKIGDAREIAMTMLGDAPMTRVYLCGAPEFVLPMRKQVFLSGVPLKQIFSDAFLPTRVSE